LQFIRNRGKIRAAKAAGENEIAKEKYCSILEDFEYLLRRARKISSRCLEGINIITNDVVLEESRKAMAQGEQTKI
jgi:hypothetical protein